MNLFFEHFTNKTVKAKDVFDRILKHIDNTYIFQKYYDDMYVIVDPELLDEYIDNDYTIFDRYGREYVNISTMKITFFEIPEEDRHEVRDHLLDLYGKEAVRYQLIEEGELVGGKRVGN